MKKVLALLVICGLMVGLVGVYAADAAVKKPVKKVVKKAVVKKAAPRVAPAPAPIAPPPAAIVPPPPPAVRPVAAAPTGLLGIGLNATAGVGMVGSMLDLAGAVLLPDPMGLGAMVGLPANSVAWKLGAGYASGNDKDSKSWRAPHVIIDGIVNLPADMMGGIESYIGGGLNYVVGRSGGGSYGGQAYAGVQGNLGLGGKTYGQVGLGLLRTGAQTPRTNGRSTGFGLGLLVGQTILL